MSLLYLMSRHNEIGVSEMVKVETWYVDRVRDRKWNLHNDVVCNH